MANLLTRLPKTPAESRFLPRPTPLTDPQFQQLDMAKTTWSPMPRFIRHDLEEMGLVETRTVPEPSRFEPGKIDDAPVWRLTRKGEFALAEARRARQDITNRAAGERRGATQGEAIEQPTDPAPITSDDSCTNPGGHEFECTGTAYGGDDESYHGEGRCYCIHCGADGDA